MFVKHRRIVSGARKATIITQAVIFGGMVGVGMAALAIDTGLMYAAKQELQSAADAAALAAASQLGASTNAQAQAKAEATVFANLNKVAGDNADLMNSDVEFGHAILNVDRYEFQPGAEPFDAVKVSLRRDATVSDGPVSLLFGKALGVDGADMQANAIAMLVPRDIGIVVDLSGSMNDDSEFRHSDDYPSETAGAPAQSGVQVNLRDIWCALNGPSPAHPYLPGDPTQTEYAGDTGPTWGLMTTWGSDVVLGSYDATTDPGLLYLKKTVNCTNGTVTSQLLGRNYKNVASSSPSTLHEVDCLMLGTKDNNYGNNFKNRAKVMLGLADWKSGKSQSKYGHNIGGDGDDYVEDSEMTAQVSYPSGMTGGSWDSYLSYVAGTSKMSETNADLRYRYGLKTFVNYLLEKQNSNARTPQLVGAPELPMTSVKDAVQTLIDTIVELDTQDHCSLEVFATTGRHEVDLVTPGDGESLSTVLQVIPDTLYQRQSGHYDSTTCIGCGFDKAITELTTSRARTAAAKVIILLTDGKPNVSATGESPEDYATGKATEAAEQGMTIYTVGVGGDANDGFLEQLAQIGHGEYFFADNAPDPSTGQPMYVAQLQEIFKTLGGKRPVRLIK